jgi:hypothetical protein
MARPKKIKNNIQPLATPPSVAPGLEDDKVSELPYALRRELEEIMKNSGRMIDFALPIKELEEICNRANNPPNAWRNRWANN